jgi:plastocyanin
MANRRVASHRARVGRRLVEAILIGSLTVAFSACGNLVRQAHVGPVCIESRERLLDPGPVVVVNTENDPNLPAFVTAWAYAPSLITAKVGQVIEFRNLDPDSQHTAELDSGACGTDYLDLNDTDALVFDVPGSYPFHCLVHGTAMVGTITIVH